MFHVKGLVPPEKISQTGTRQIGESAEFEKGDFQVLGRPSDALHCKIDGLYDDYTLYDIVGLAFVLNLRL